MPLNHPLLHIDKSEANVPFEMRTIQWIEQNRPEQNAVPHRHDYFVVIWVRKGSGVHLIDLDKLEISDNTVYCISPGQIHLLKANEGIDGCIISFSSEFLCFKEDNYDLLFNSGLFYTFNQTPVIKISEALQPELHDISIKLLKEYENFFLLRSEILRGYLKIFLIYLTRQFNQTDKAPQAKNIELVKNFFSLLDKHFTTKKMVSDYAADLVVTPNYLNEIVKKTTGFTASDHIKNRIVLEAKRHAAYVDVSMKEIAYSLGFDDVAHFSKYFKNATGINFTDFKKDLPNYFT
jgi:AraC-like DNA-binding protein